MMSAIDRALALPRTLGAFTRNCLMVVGATVVGATVVVVVVVVVVVEVVVVAEVVVDVADVVDVVVEAVACCASSRLTRASRKASMSTSPFSSTKSIKLIPAGRVRAPTSFNDRAKGTVSSPSETSYASSSDDTIEFSSPNTSVALYPNDSGLNEVLST